MLLPIQFLSSPSYDSLSCSCKRNSQAEPQTCGSAFPPRPCAKHARLTPAGANLLQRRQGTHGRLHMTVESMRYPTSCLLDEARFHVIPCTEGQHGALATTAPPPSMHVRHVGRGVRATLATLRAPAMTATPAELHATPIPAGRSPRRPSRFPRCTWAPRHMGRCPASSSTGLRGACNLSTASTACEADSGR